MSARRPQTAVPPVRGPGTVIGLLGPTGVGKTAVAVALAAATGVSVISCDSMQLYSGFPVLTNQPTLEEACLVRHEMVGVIDPEQTFSAGEYAAAVQPLIEAELTRTGWALLAGGTGLYLRAALAPLAMAPVVDLRLRRTLEAQAAAEGPVSLHAELAELDPAAAAAIGPANTRRLIRALEVIQATGRPWSGRDDLWEPTYYNPTLLVALTLERAELCRRIDQRAEAIVRGGAVEEVRRYLEAKTEITAAKPGVAQKTRSSTVAEAAQGGAELHIGRAESGIESAIGFREVRRLAEGRQSVEETVAQVATATRRYARRQATWLRKLRGAVIIDVHDRGPGEIADHLLKVALSGEHTKEPQQP